MCLLSRMELPLKLKAMWIKALAFAAALLLLAVGHWVGANGQTPAQESPPGFTLGGGAAVQALWLDLDGLEQAVSTDFSADVELGGQAFFLSYVGLGFGGDAARVGAASASGEWAGKMGNPAFETVQLGFS